MPGDPFSLAMVWDYQDAMFEYTSDRKIFFILGGGVLLLALAALLLGGRLRGRPDESDLLGVDNNAPESDSAAEMEDFSQLPAMNLSNPSPTALQDDLPIFQPPDGISNLKIEVIVDASASMSGALDDGTIKQDAVRDNLLINLPTYNPETSLGLRAFGEETCQDFAQVASVRPGQMPVIAGWLADYQGRGPAPLQLAITEAMKDFDQGDGKTSNHIVLISDGDDSCGGDPCQWLNLAARTRLNVTFHVLGLSVDKAAETQLSCIADRSGGLYFDVRSAGDFQQALETVQELIFSTQAIISYPAATSTAEALAEALNATRIAQLAQAIDDFVTPEFTPVPPTATWTPTPTITPTPSASPTITATATIVLPTATIVPSPLPPPTEVPESGSGLVDPTPQSGGCSGVSCQDAGAVDPGSGGNNGSGGSNGLGADPGFPGGG